MHIVSEPAILYFGTPVVLISTLNENGTYNLAPMSSAFWLGWNCIIGLGASSKTTENIIRTKQCVLNLPSVNEVIAVDRLALTTGTNPVPAVKQQRGYRFESGKFEIAHLTPAPADAVAAPRVSECPVQMEAALIAVHLEESILMTDNKNKVDPEKWRPLIMSFQKFYGLGEEVHPSKLSQIPEHLYRN